MTASTPICNQLTTHINTLQQLLIQVADLQDRLVNEGTYPELAGHIDSLQKAYEQEKRELTLTIWEPCYQSYPAGMRRVWLPEGIKTCEIGTVIVTMQACPDGRIFLAGDDGKLHVLTPQPNGRYEATTALTAEGAEWTAGGWIGTLHVTPDGRIFLAGDDGKLHVLALDQNGKVTELV
jgi:hypothetical protein